jgi:hypothetical protein
MYRQGDVLIVPAQEIPDDARAVDHCVLATGEATGHAHRIESGAVQLVTAGGEQFVRVEADQVEVRHEEHASIFLPGPAVYRIVHQREYAPPALPDRSTAAVRTRRVAD